MAFATGLTYEDAEDIRAIYAGGGWTQAQLAAIYGVCAEHVSRIVRGLRWRGDFTVIGPAPTWDIEKLIAISEGRNAAIAALGGSGFPRAAVQA